MPQVRRIVPFLSEETLGVYYSPGQLPLQATTVTESTPRHKALHMCHMLITPVNHPSALGRCSV